MRAACPAKIACGNDRGYVGIGSIGLFYPPLPACQETKNVRAACLARKIPASLAKCQGLEEQGMLARDDGEGFDSDDGDSGRDEDGDDDEQEEDEGE